LASGTGLGTFAIDCNEWMQTANISADPELIFSPQWFNLLTLVAESDTQKAHGQS